MFFQNEQLKYYDDQCYDEHEEGDAINTMHVFHPLGMWSFRISFPDKEVLGQLSQNAHDRCCLWGKFTTIPTTALSS
jgi:hypothetical protein